MYFEIQLRSDTSDEVKYEISPNKVQNGKATLPNKFFKWTNRETRWETDMNTIIFRVKSYVDCSKWGVVTQWALRNFAP